MLELRCFVVDEMGMHKHDLSVMDELHTVCFLITLKMVKRPSFE